MSLCIGYTWAKIYLSLYVMISTVRVKLGDINDCFGLFPLTVGCCRLTVIATCHYCDKQ